MLLQTTYKQCSNKKCSCPCLLQQLFNLDTKSESESQYTLNFTMKVSWLFLAAIGCLRWTTSEILQMGKILQRFCTCVGHYHGQRLGLARPRRLQFCPDSDSVVGAAASQKVLSHLIPIIFIFITPIPDICHLFYTSRFWGLKILHSKVRKFATKIASRQHSVNYTLCVNLHTVCMKFLPMLVVASFTSLVS